MTVVTRFAPAPTGYLHVGHAFNALQVWGFARQHGGRVLLRIEDHDRMRCRPEFERAMFEDLEWLGFAADGPVVRQRERGAIYEEHLERLRRLGLIYACACSRTDIGGERYPGICRDKGLAMAPGLGIRVRLAPATERFDDLRLGPQQQTPSDQCGDLLLRDRHGNWTYQFAVVVDDWLQEVTHVVRGVDLLDSTGRQIQLGRLLGRPSPPSFLHHALLMRTPTQKLSKSDRDTGVRDLRGQGWSAGDVLALALRSGEL